MVRALSPWRDRTWLPFEDLYRQMDSLFQGFLDGDNAQKPNGQKFHPALNVAETAEAFEISVDLPGVDPKQLQVEVQEGQLVIAGQRDWQQEESDKTYHRVERGYGAFRRVLTLPQQVEQSKITADYHDGVLKVVVPKSEKLKPRRIEISCECGSEK